MSGKSKAVVEEPLNGEILPPDLAWPATLALEVRVAGSADVVCGKYNITKEEFQQIAATPEYREQRRAARELLKGDTSAAFRVLADVYSIDALHVLHRLSRAVDQPGSVRSDAAKHLVKIAGRDASAAQAAGASGLTININLG